MCINIYIYMKLTIANCTSLKKSKYHTKLFPCSASTSVTETHKKKKQKQHQHGNSFPMKCHEPFLVFRSFLPSATQIHLERVVLDVQLLERRLCEQLAYCRRRCQRGRGVKVLLWEFTPLLPHPSPKK